MKKLKIIFLLAFVFCYLSSLAYSQVAVVVQEDKTRIISVSRDGDILASNGKTYGADSVALVKKAKRFSNDVVRVVYYVREHENYCVDVIKEGVNNNGRDFMTERKVFHKKNNK